MDGRELRRHWRCLPVRLWDGRAGRISVCRPHRTNVWNHTILLDNQPEREPLNNNEEKQMKKTIIDPFFYSDSVHLIGAVKDGEAEALILHWLSASDGETTFLGHPSRPFKALYVAPNDTQESLDRKLKSVGIDPKTD